MSMKGKDVLVVGNREQPFDSDKKYLFSSFGSLRYNHAIFCNRIGAKRAFFDIYANKTSFFIDGEIIIDKDFIYELYLLQDLPGIDCFYIYALNQQAKFIQTLLEKLGCETEAYCPACRTEHDDMGDITGMHWPLPLTNVLQGRPFTGFLAIYKALLEGAKKVYVTGFDLYKNKDTGGWPSQVGPHKIALHADWLWNMSAEVLPESRIILLPDTRKAVKECREFFNL